MLRRANARRLPSIARAAEDRLAAQAELALETADDLTGALRRNAGLEALRRELERRRRTHESLTVALLSLTA